MPALAQRNRVFASPWRQTNPTSPGVAQVRTLANRTGLGASEEAFVDTWEQLRFVLAQARYFDLITPANYQGSGCNVVFVVAKPEAPSAVVLINRGSLCAHGSRESAISCAWMGWNPKI